VAPPMTLAMKQVAVSASVGVAVTDAGMSAGELLRNADMAMYRAKNAGGGRFEVFEPGMHAAALRRMELTGSLRDAIDDEQFTLHYQPIVDARSGRTLAMEALVRWVHPQDGLLPPVEFIPALEDSGLIVALGEWILHRACLDATAWPEDIGVNVNLSSRQLEDPEVVQHVVNALEMTGLAATRLTLEITESALMQHSASVVRRIAELRERGVKLAIDDFGTGYSSLAYLRTFPVDELKIDKCFIDALSTDDAGLPLVATIAHLARSLSLTIVAEGVETSEQARWLTDLGCDALQGYFFARPKPVADALLSAVVPSPRHVA
jgi:predicted signal transduction protein with EAL and GGDEF domain